MMGTKDKTGGKGKGSGKGKEPDDTKGTGKDGELLKFGDRKDIKPGQKLVTKPFKHILPVECTQDELMKAGKELAHCHGDLERIEAGMVEARKKAAADREPINKRVSQLVHTLDTGEKDVKINCHRVLDYTEVETRFIRTDTGKEFHRRPMLDDERQRLFEFFNPTFDIDRH